MISNDVEEKQIELAELLSNYNNILKFIKTKLSEEELNYYLEFFKENKVKTRPPIIENRNSERCEIITMWGDEI